MPRSSLSLTLPRFLVLAGLSALAISCGPQPVAPATATAQVASSAGYAPLVSMPAAEFQGVATMALISEGVAISVRDYLRVNESDVADEHVADEHASVPVTFRLGPKMASRTFSIGLDGEVAPDELKALRGMFRCRRSGRTHKINKGLFAKIADLSAHYEGHTLEIISAYRHGKNAKPGSRHGQGRAIDIRVVGVPAAQVRDYLWARYDQEVGVGFYKEQQFVHLDHRHDYPATAWTQKHHSDANDYNPRWSRPERRAKLVVALAETNS